MNLLTVLETPEFTADAKKIWSEAEYEAFIDFIAASPEAGDVIPGSGGCRKVRWRRPGMGKRGGARIIYFRRLAHGQIVLMMIYAKAAQDTISPDVLAKGKELLDA